MTNIIVNYRPFTLAQEIFVYDGKSCIKSLQAPIDRIPDIVSGLQSRYNIEQINLCGNQDYLSRFQAELSLKFANSNVEINIVSK